MDQHARFRQTLTASLGKTVTPELAAALEMAAFDVPDTSIDPGQFAPEQYDGLVFAAESLRAIREELHPLHEAHFAETERARAGQAMKPDYGYMEMAERTGRLLQFTARSRGALVGNCRMYLFQDLHTGTRGANEDTLFLLPAARHGFTASRFIDYAERCLARIGVEDVWVDTKILHDEAGRVIRDVGVLMKRRGYAHVANKFHKRISKE